MLSVSIYKHTAAHTRAHTHTHIQEHICKHTHTYGINRSYGSGVYKSIHTHIHTHTVLIEVTDLEYIMFKGLDCLAIFNLFKPHNNPTR